MSSGDVCGRGLSSRPISAGDGGRSNVATRMIGFKTLLTKGELLIKGSGGGETPLSRYVSCGRGDASGSKEAFELRNRSVAARPTSREARATAVSGAGVALAFEIGFSCRND